MGYLDSACSVVLMIKVLDGCGGSNHFWVFIAAATDQEFTVNMDATRTFTACP